MDKVLPDGDGSEDGDPAAGDRAYALTIASSFHAGGPVMGQLDP